MQVVDERGHGGEQQAQAAPEEREGHERRGRQRRLGSHLDAVGDEQGDDQRGAQGQVEQRLALVRDEHGLVGELDARQQRPRAPL